MKPLLFLLLLFALFFVAIVLQAQTDTKSQVGMVQGCVADPEGSPIAGARIEVLGTSRGAVTKPDGMFSILALPVGIYRLKISSAAMKTAEFQVTITPNDTATLDVALEFGVNAADSAILCVSRVEPEASGKCSTPKGNIGAAMLREASVGVPRGGYGIRGGRAGEASIRRDRTEISDPVQTVEFTGALGGGLSTSPPTFDAEYGDELGDSFFHQAPSTILPQNLESKKVSPQKPQIVPLYENGFRVTSGSPFSTFSIDVDNASYSNIRGALSRGTLPPPAAVRIEEMVNYFNYNYPEPNGSHPFAFHSEVLNCPWNSEHLIVKLALQGKRIQPQQAAAANLVFLIDVSGSMSDANKLPLLKQAFSRFVDELRPQDHVAIVVYAGAAGLVLESTPGSDKKKIKDALNNLQSGGSTAGGAGIQLAYNVARDNFLPDGINRVILATDGDFNVGLSSDDGLVKLIEEKRKDGVFLSVLGFGDGNYQDTKMEKLADNGNGNYYYIDKLKEGERVLVEEMSGTLYAIAKDVKLQIKFNPAKVSAYRLIGYENRVLAAKDFDNDAKDAGELGAGHTVTAMYEVVPVGSAIGYAPDTTKGEEYQLDEGRPELLSSHDLLLARLRYKEPSDSVSKLIEHLVKDDSKEWERASEGSRFALSVAEFGMVLRGSAYKGSGSYDEVLKIAESSTGSDVDGYRKEFIELVEKAKALAETLKSVGAK